MSLADSSKHIIQIVQLLEERSMSFSFCLNKNEMLTLCGLSILYQGLDLKQEGKLMQESQRLITSVVQILTKNQAPGASDFNRLASSIIRLESPSPMPSSRSTSHMAAPQSSKSTPSPSVARQQLRPQIYRQHSATMSENDLLSQQEKLRRATMPHIALPRQEYHHGRSSMDSTRSESPMSRREYNPAASTIPTVVKRRSTNDKPPNLDYLSLSNTPVASQPQSPALSRQAKPQLSNQTQNHNSNLLTSMFPNTHTTYSQSSKSTGVSPSEWEVLLGSLDGGQTNLYDAIYGGPALSLSDNTTASSYGAWSPDSQWDIASLGMGDFTSAPSQGGPRSVLSFSEESLSSGEEMSTSELGGRLGDYGSSLLPGSVGSADGYLLDGLENTFGL